MLIFLQWFLSAILAVSGAMGFFDGGSLFGCAVTMACGIYLAPPVAKHVNMPRWTLILVGIAGLAAWSSTQPVKLEQATLNSTESVAAVNDAEPVKSRKEIVEGYFSAYDGSHPQLERAIKKSMNDPDSYDHDETRFRDDGATIYVFSKFRGKNAFGAVVVSYAEGTLNGATGDLLSWKFVNN